MVDVELVYMKNIVRDGEVVDTIRLKREIISVEKLSRKEIEKHIELDEADFVDVFYFNKEAGQWVYAGSYIRDGWAFSILPE